MEQPTAEPRPAPDSGATSRKSAARGFLLVACVLAGASVAAWSTAMVLMSNRGFDVTDEGYYLLSYEWWHTNLRAGVGAQYVYGPVYALLQHDIAALRGFRLASVVAANGFLGWNFMRWLRLQRPRADASRLWEVAGALAITASGGIGLAWLPLTPGYNDATALGSVVATALVFVIARHTALGSATPDWVPAVLGAFCFGLVLTKWSTAPVVGVILAVAAIVVAPGGRAAVARLLALFVTGFAAAAALEHVFVVRLDDAIPPMLEVNRLSSEGEDHQIGGILSHYLRSTFDLVWHTGRGHVALFLLALVAGLLSASTASRSRWVVPVCVVALLTAFGASVRFVIDDGGWHGGPPSLLRFSSTLLALSTVVALATAGTLFRRLRQHPRAAAWSHAVLPLMLIVVPLLQPLGTNNALWAMAVNAFACWMALLIWLATSIDPRAVLARGTAVAALGALLVAIPVITTDGLLNNPYRAAPYDANTAAMPMRTPLGDLRMPPSDIRGYVALREALRPHLQPAPASVQAFDKMPGLVLMLGARPVGEAWTGPTATLRSAAGLVAECRDGTLSQPPILLYNRPPGDQDRDALAECGFDLDRDYRELPVRRGPPGVTVYVPAR